MAAHADVIGAIERHEASFHGVSLTKRELFAAMAMQGLASVPADGGLKPSYIKNDAEHAVAYADALLAELAKEQS